MCWFCVCISIVFCCRALGPYLHHMHCLSRLGLRLQGRQEKTAVEVVKLVAEWIHFKLFGIVCTFGAYELSN